MHLCLFIFFIFALLLGLPNEQAKAQSSPFLVKPYLQLGNNAKIDAFDNEELLWLSKEKQGEWSVQIKTVGDQDWKKAAASPKIIQIQPGGGGSDYLFDSKLAKLPLGKPFAYRVLKNGQVVFEAQAQARKGDKQPYTFGLFGDLAAGTPAQKKIAYQCYKAKPDLVVMPGDLVYGYGLFSEYLAKYFPVYNADQAAPEIGAPLIRSVCSVGVLGNHDIALAKFSLGGDLGRFPDALAYFFLWSQPLNGPLHRGDANTPPLAGSEKAKANFSQEAGLNFPTMANFSFDYGDSHWLVLDANYYMHWTDPRLRKWVADDLARAQKMPWRFVTFHQPGFSIDIEHSSEQRMRLLADLFEKGKVDIVFSGHAHNYQRSFPLYFKAKSKDNLPQINDNGTVDGEFTLDQQFDGNTRKEPHGVIYIVSGGGGAPLYPVIVGYQTNPSQQFIQKSEAYTHSLTLCNVNRTSLDCKQISEDGGVIDHFVISKETAFAAK